MLIFYDLETTGLNVFHNRITEICCIKQIPLDFNDQTFITLINPEAEMAIQANTPNKGLFSAFSSAVL